MSISIAELNWMAGLLEGEGCFYFYRNCPSIHLGMTDYDVVERASRYLGCRVRGPQRRNLSKKDVWVASIYGRDAVGWMMTLYSLLGKRRREKIRECIAAWRKVQVWQKLRTHCPQGHEYNAENTRYYHGRRHCRTCQLNRSRDAMRAKRDAALKERKEIPLLIPHVVSTEADKVF